MKSAGFPLRCSGDQLRNFTARARAAKKCSVPRKEAPMTVGELQAAASAHAFPAGELWQQQPVTKLMVLPTSVCGSDRVCMMFTCPGMLRRAAAAQGKVVKLAVDGKQKILSNEYIILTLSFLVSNDVLSKTWAGRWHQKSVSSHTGTQEPFMQALVNAESEANVSCVFNSACQLAEQHCKLDLKSQVWQVHKDYAKGIEASRKKVFPAARPCDDYPHMRRASYKVLQKHLSSLQGKAADTFQVLDRVIRLSRALPTVQLFDATWQLVFPRLEKLCKPAAGYLQATYFCRSAPSGLQKQLHCTETLWGADAVWFAGFWAGVLGTYPGSSSGTQPLESFHGYWQSRLSDKKRASPTQIFEVMQKVYEEDWCDKFSWSEERAFLTWPAQPAAALLNSQSLRSAGRSPAVDYWHERARKAMRKLKLLQGNSPHRPEQHRR